jgi:protein-L-isoaspartate(D-aspartate) O-methyltransferase
MDIHDNASFKKLRHAMVDEQISQRGIRDSQVLKAFEHIPRHEFVPLSLRSFAYQDRPLDIGEGQTISQPYMVALMTEELRLTKDKEVLEIGTGSGYQTAALAELSGSVYTIERIEKLSLSAQETLAKLQYHNIVFRVGDGSRGWVTDDPKAHLFDAIILTAGVPDEPQNLFSQLKEGGRLLAPIGPRDRQTLMLYEKNDGVISSREICKCVFVPLIGQYAWGG